MVVAPGVDEVYQRILDRIVTGFYPVGSRLPSCRALASEFGSNSSTVDRAIGRLASRGRVQTIPRRGSFVQQSEEATVDARDVVAAQLDEVLMRARRLGFTAAELGAMVDVAMDRVDSMRRIAVVECNERDLRKIQALIQNAIDVEVQPVLLNEAQGRTLDEEFDAVAVPIFHLNEIAEVINDFDRVVELNLVASPAALRQLIEVRNEDRLVVLAPTARGVQWMTALVGQYFPGEIVGLEFGKDDLAVLQDAAVLVVNNAAEVPSALTDQVHKVIAIEWELDGRFTTALKSRIEQVIRMRALADTAIGGK